MKNLKALMLVGAMAISSTAFAQFANSGSATSTVNDNAEYSRFGVSYLSTGVSFNKDAGGSDNDFTLSGFSIDYLHGFSVSSQLPVFVEVGVNADFGYYSDSESTGSGDYKYTTTSKTQGINLQVPINLAYRLKTSEDFTILPFIGLNLKYGITLKSRAEQERVIKGETETEKGDWASYYSKDDMGDSDSTFNRFQIGWHIGVGFQYKPLYVGISYGSDFTPIYKHDDAKITTNDLKVSLAYCF